MATTSEFNFRPLGLGLGTPGCPFMVMSIGAGANVAKQQGDQAAELRPIFKKMKAVQDMVRYTKEELVKHAKRFYRCPPELEYSKLSVVVPEAQRERNRQQVLQLIGSEEDTWRAPAGEAGARKPGWDAAEGPEAGRRADGPEGKEEFAKIQTAAEVGQKAWRPTVGQTATDLERAVKQIRGILNRLAPEKFERLFQQLLEVVTTAETLRKTITLVFEKAVSEPSFTFLYVDLCMGLSKELPEFPPPAGETKPIAFRKVLLNTCHDEFESARQERLAQRARGAAGEDPDEADRRVKQRMIGTVRLIAHLYLKGEVPQWVMSELVQDLLHPPKGQATDEDDVETLCEMFAVAGKALEERAQDGGGKDGKGSEKAKVERHFKRLAELSQDKSLSSRVRFLVRDILDLRANKWVPRREVQTAKKLDEIRAEAELALGVSIPKTDAGAGSFASLAPRGGQREVELFPALREGGAAGQGRYTHRTGAGEVASGLLGDFVPRATPPAATGNVNRSDEELEKMMRGMIEEFVAVGDEKELVTCMNDLNNPAWMPKLVSEVATRMLDMTSERDQGMAIKLMGVLTRRGYVQSAHLTQSLGTLLSEMGDLSMDYPLATRLLGSLLGSVIADGTVPLTALPPLFAPIEDPYLRREMALFVINHMRSRMDDAKIGAAFREHGISGASFLSHNPEVDGDMPDVADFLKENDLAFIPA